MVLNLTRASPKGTTIFRFVLNFVGTVCRFSVIVCSVLLLLRCLTHPY